MLSINEIKQFIEEDATSEKKMRARVGQKYYEGNHDINSYRIWYYNADGVMVEDKTRSNVKISHAFFTELVDQGTQYILSGDGRFVKSDNPALQKQLDKYFNDDEDFIAELSETLTGCQAKGFEYMFAYKNVEDRIAFQCADGMGVVEVRAKDTDSNTEHMIYWYIDRIEKGKKKIKRIQVWDTKEVYFYVQDGEGNIELDKSVELNPKPHTLYKKSGSEKTYFDKFGFIPFFRLDNNKKQVSNLNSIKALIDDYDLMACGLSNNIQDAAEYLVVAEGFQGDMNALMQNVRTKKHIGVDEGGSIDFKTVDIPHEARMAKLELDEKNIYRFGFGLNLSGLKDTSATTNIAIKAAYSLLDLRCAKLEIRLKQFLRKLIKVVLKEINAVNGTDYQMNQVYFDFSHSIMSNAQENAQIDLIEAQRKQTEITTLLNLAAHMDNETIMQLVCEQLDISFEDIKNKLPDPEEAANAVKDAQGVLNNVVVDNEQTAEGSAAAILG